MTASSNSISIGYLSVVERPDVGFFGGLLSVDENARPLEFHCTQPMQPSHAQCVFYGKTLHRFLSEDLIPTALVKKTKRTPDLILVRNGFIKVLREVLGIPCCMLAAVAEMDEDSVTDDQLAGTDLQIDGMTLVESAEFRGWVCSELDSDRNVVQSGLSKLGQHVDPLEPFDRLQLALAEVGKAANHAA